MLNFGIFYLTLVNYRIIVDVPDEIVKKGMKKFSLTRKEIDRDIQELVDLGLIETDDSGKGYKITEKGENHLKRNYEVLKNNEDLR